MYLISYSNDIPPPQLCQTPENPRQLCQTPQNPQLVKSPHRPRQLYQIPLICAGRRLKIRRIGPSYRPLRFKPDVDSHTGFYPVGHIVLT